MRHRKSFNHLGRTTPHRKAMLSNMASSLIMHKRITTTTAKAKALRMFVEPLITKSKDDTTHSRRVVFSYLQDKDAVTELFREVSPKIAERQGGYTRIIKLGARLGDSAEMAIIELVDFNENLLGSKSSSKSGSRRRRRGGSKSTAETSVAEIAVADEKEEVLTEAKEETVVAEEVTAEEVVAEEAENVAEEALEAKETVAEKVEEIKAEDISEAKEENIDTEDAGEEKKES
jgi:large subunit ribosomal protein L17